MKTNPRRKPATAADVNKAFQNGCILTMDIMLFTLTTDMEVTPEWMDFFNERYMAHLRAHKAGYLSQEDMRKTAKEECGLEFELV